MARIIPGVEIQVVKEVLPPQLAPSGVLGLVGLTEKIPEQVARVSNCRPLHFPEKRAHFLDSLPMAKGRHLPQPPTAYPLGFASRNRLAYDRDTPARHVA